MNDDVAVVLAKTSYEKVVQAFGAKGLLLTSDSKIDSIIEQAQKIAREGIPVLINAHIAKTDFREGSLSV